MGGIFKTVSDTVLAVSKPIQCRPENCFLSCQPFHDRFDLPFCALVDVVSGTTSYQVQDDIIQGALRADTPGSLESPWVVFTAGAMVSGWHLASRPRSFRPFRI